MFRGERVPPTERIKECFLELETCVPMKEADSSGPMRQCEQGHGVGEVWGRDWEELSFGPTRACGI